MFLYYDTQYFVIHINVSTQLLFSCSPYTRIWDILILNISSTKIDRYLEYFLKKYGGS